MAREGLRSSLSAGPALGSHLLLCTLRTGGNLWSQGIRTEGPPDDARRRIRGSEETPAGQRSNPCSGSLMEVVTHGAPWLTSSGPPPGLQSRSLSLSFVFPAFVSFSPSLHLSEIKWDPTASSLCVLPLTAQPFLLLIKICSHCTV